MRYIENERYYTAESTNTWLLDPLIHQNPPAFFIIAVLWNQTFDHSDYPQTTSDFFRLPPNLLQRALRSLQNPELAVKSIALFTEP